MEDILEGIRDENDARDEEPPHLITGDSDCSDRDDNNIDYMYQIEQEQEEDDQCQLPDDPVADSCAWGAMLASSS